MKIISIKGELFADFNRMHFIIIPRKFNDQKFEKFFTFRKNQEQKSFVFMHFVLSQQSQVTAEYPDLTLQFIYICSLYISRHSHFIYLFQILLK